MAAESSTLLTPLVWASQVERPARPSYGPGRSPCPWRPPQSLLALPNTTWSTMDLETGRPGNILTPRLCRERTSPSSAEADRCAVAEGESPTAAAWDSAAWVSASCLTGCPDAGIEALCRASHATHIATVALGYARGAVGRFALSTSLSLRSSTHPRQPPCRSAGCNDGPALWQPRSGPAMTSSSPWWRPLLKEESSEQHCNGDTLTWWAANCCGVSAGDGVVSMEELLVPKA
mmetsp:Transcript_12162/g.28558  ORF Transcript_12162/g.28558 Transcript_12162/m.28558 type:complete len:233 (-) Transcript_12162:227-925(-)